MPAGSGGGEEAGRVVLKASAHGAQGDGGLAQLLEQPLRRHLDGTEVWGGRDEVVRLGSDGVEATPQALGVTRPGCWTGQTRLSDRTDEALGVSRRGCRIGHTRLSVG